MKRIVLPVLFAVVAWSTVARAQEAMIDSLSGIGSDPNFVWVANVEGGASTFVWAQDTGDKPAGFDASLDIKTKIDSLHAWGSFSQLIYRLPSGQYMDLSSSDTLRLWMKVVKAPIYPQYMSFRIQLLDQDQASDPTETYIYQNDLILDNTGSWVQLKLPLHEINSQGGTVVPADSGFVEAPYNWGGFTWNNHKLDLDKIVGWNLVMVTTTTSLNPNPPAGYANVPLDSLEVKFAGFDRTGNKPVPFVIFNGISTPSNLSIFTWGNASVSTETKNGPFPNTNSLHWVMGDQWSNGWNGWGYNVAPAFNLSGGWPVDTFKFYMKADPGVDSMSVQFEDGSAKVRADFNVLQDGAWHQYAIPLSSITWRQDTNPGNFNPENVVVWQIMSAADGIAGKNVWLSDIWTGNPPHPVPPVAVTGLAVVTNSNYTNIISWNDVPSQTNETYNVYYSTQPITTVDTSIVDVAATGVAHGVDSYTHLLMAPKTDQSVQYYYAVVCKSSDGLLGNVAATSTSYTNTAKGIPTIAPLWKLGSAFNFVADGNLSEWKNAGITPFRLYTSDGSGTAVSNSHITGDDVSSGDIYVAVDQTYLYVAGHINTNNIVFNASQSSWLNTSTDMFLGLYNYHGAPHSGLQGGTQPDYHFRFAEDRVIVDNNGTDSLVLPGANYYWAQRLVPDPLDGYNFEVKVSWADLAHKRHGGYTGTDTVFVPHVGERIPFDLELSSVSSGATSRDGQLDLSPIAQGNSYANVALWSFTWIGDQMVMGVPPNTQTPTSYELTQNYPNPFNPTTTIRYSLMKPGQVTMNVFNVLGEKVATLIDRYQSAGSYTVTFEASKFASGIYFYEIKSGSFRSVKKMMLIK